MMALLDGWTWTGLDYRWTVGKGLSIIREWPEQLSPGNRFERSRRRVVFESMWYVVVG